nr:hypothetical protein BaRGS_032699 [Batillaria attramentaria]
MVMMTTTTTKMTTTKMMIMIMLTTTTTTKKKMTTTTMMMMMMMMMMMICSEVNVRTAISVLSFNSVLNPFLYTLAVVLERRKGAEEGVAGRGAALARHLLDT